MPGSPGMGNGRMVGNTVGNGGSAEGKDGGSVEGKGMVNGGKTTPASCPEPLSGGLTGGLLLVVEVAWWVGAEGACARGWLGGGMMAAGFVAASGLALPVGVGAGGTTVVAAVPGDGEVGHSLAPPLPEEERTAIIATATIRPATATSAISTPAESPAGARVRAGRVGCATPGVDDCK